MTDAPDMRAAAEAALARGRSTFDPVAGAIIINDEMGAHIVASQPSAVLAVLDAHAAEVSALRAAFVKLGRIAIEILERIPEDALGFREIDGDEFVERVSIRDEHLHYMRKALVGALK